MLCHPYQGDLKQFPNNDEDGEPIDEYEIIALAKRLGISIEEMKDMSFVSLLNIMNLYRELPNSYEPEIFRKSK